MLKLKTLLVLIPAIISLNYVTPLQNQQPAKQISFFDARDTVVLTAEDYTLVQNEVGFNIMVLNKIKLKKIGELDNPQSKLTIDNKSFTAKGLDVISSRLPDQADYFFPLDHRTKRIFASEKNIISFRKIGK